MGMAGAHVELIPVKCCEGWCRPGAAAAVAE